MSKRRKTLVLVSVLGASLLVGSVASLLDRATCDQDPGGRPVWSPDGRRVAFQEGTDIDVINVDGTGLRRVIRGSCPAFYFPSWSPDSRSLAFERSGESVGIEVFDLRTGARRPAFDVRFEPAWSPDGRWIVFDTVRGIYVVQPDGSGWREVTNRAGDTPDWSPDGKQIVFADRGLYVVPLKAGKPRRILDHGESPAWSPDGRRIAFSTRGEIGVIRPDGSPLPAAYKCEQCDVSDPNWSPDGKRLVFYESGIGIRIVSVGSRRVRTLAKM